MADKEPDDVDYSTWTSPYVTDADLAKEGSKRWDPYGVSSPADVKAYKANYKTGKLETLPMTWTDKTGTAVPWGTPVPDKTPAIPGVPRYDDSALSDMAAHLHALQASKQFGGPDVSPEDLGALLNQEGRGDFGLNYGRSTYAHDKQAMALADKLVKAGYEPDLPASLLAAQHTSKRLGVPWQKIWNGTGVAKLDNAGHTHSGSDYNREIALNRAAITDPKNADFLNYVRSNMNAPPDLDILNQQEQGRRQALRQKEVDRLYNIDARQGQNGVFPLDQISHGLGALKQFKNPFADYTPQELEAYYRGRVEDEVPKVRAYTPRKKKQVATNAKGGPIEVDDGNPAKRRRMI